MKETKISKIERKNGHYLIYLNEEMICLSESFFLDEHLYVGKEISHNDLIRLRHLSSLSEPYEYAVRLLGRNSYSKHSLKEKMKIKFPDFEDSNEIIYLLEKSSLLDDKEYAEQFKNAKEVSLYGPNKIKRVLIYEKGVNKDIVNGLGYLSENKTLDQLFPILDKRYMDLPYKSKAAKLEKIMFDRGFSRDIAKEYAAKATIDKEKQNKRLRSDYEKAKRRLEKKYDGYQLKQRIIRSLLSKGYKMNDIEELIEDE